MPWKNARDLEQIVDELTRLWEAVGGGVVGCWEEVSLLASSAEMDVSSGATGEKPTAR